MRILNSKYVRIFLMLIDQGFPSFCFIQTIFGKCKYIIFFVLFKVLDFLSALKFYYLILLILKLNNKTNMMEVIYEIICFERRLTTVCHQFWQAKFAIDGLILSSSRFLMLPQLLKNQMRVTKKSNMTQKYSFRCVNLNQGCTIQFSGRAKNFLFYVRGTKLICFLHIKGCCACLI